MIRVLLHLPILLNSLVAANVRLTPVPTQAISSDTRTIVKRVVHTSVLRRAEPYLASSVHGLRNPTKLVGRSDDLYNLHIPFQDDEGYMALYLSNTTAILFCSDVGTTIYEDSAKVFLPLSVKTENSTTIVPVREDRAIEFCQNVRKNEGGGNEPTPSKGSGRLSMTAEMAGGSTPAAKSEVDETPGQSGEKPTKAAEKSTMPKSTRATTSQDDAESSPTAPTDAKNTKTAKLTKSAQATTKPAASPEAESDTTTTEVEPVTDPASSNKTPTQATTKAAANQDEEQHTTTTEVVYITPTADSTSEVMPETSFADSAESSPTPAGKPDSSDGDNSKPLPGATNKHNDEDDIPTQTTFPRTTTPPTTNDVEPPKQTGKQADAKVAEIGHQKTRSYGYVDSHTTMETSVRDGTAVRARTWESKGERRVEVLGAGFWRKKRSLKEDSSDGDRSGDEDGQKETERIPAPPRPSSTTISSSADDDDDEGSVDSESSDQTPTTPTSTKKKPAPSASQADLEPTSKSSPPTKSTKQNPTTAPSQNIDTTIPFSFPTSTSPPSIPKISAVPHARPLFPPLNPPNPSSPSSPSTNSIPNMPSPHDASSAFGAIHDPRMVWTVRFMWAIAVLQIVCGVWEFVKNVTGGCVGWGL